MCKSRPLLFSLAWPDLSAYVLLSYSLRRLPLSSGKGNSPLIRYFRFAQNIKQGDRWLLQITLVISLFCERAPSGREAFLCEDGKREFAYRNPSRQWRQSSAISEPCHFAATAKRSRSVGDFWRVHRAAEVSSGGAWENEKARPRYYYAQEASSWLETGKWEIAACTQWG